MGSPARSGRACVALICAAMLAAPVAPRALAAEPALQARLQKLEDIEAIRVLLDHYVGFNEARDYVGYADLFARDGELVLSTTRLKGPAAIRDHLQKNFGGPANASKGPQKGSSHVLTNIRIEVGGDTATSVCRWMLVTPAAGGRQEIASKGLYQDRLVREDGRWKFKERAIVTDAGA
jgi:uncharacterized protein (TIGR02246 family)